MDDAAMAKTVVMTDDVDGSANAATVSFSFEGTSYEIDLAKKNRAALEKALKPWIASARRTSGRGGRRGPGARVRRSGSAGTDLGAVRAWASANGYEVAARGRISQEVMAAYSAAK
jgi:hypothetical protein